MNRQVIKTILFGCLLCNIPVEITIAQQINSLIQSQHNQNPEIGKDININSQGIFMGEFYSCMGSKSHYKKSAGQEQSVKLLDSLNIFSYESAGDSTLIYFNINNYNANNQVSRSIILDNIESGKELNYAYNKNDKVRLIEEVRYDEGKKSGIIKRIYKYYPDGRAQSVDYKCFGCYSIWCHIIFSDYDSSVYYYEESYDYIDDCIYPWDTLDNWCHDFIEYDYEVDMEDRDTTVIISTNGMTGRITKIKYYANGKVKEKAVFKDNFEILLLQYNENGQITYYHQHIPPLWEEYEYDSCNILRYAIKKKMFYQQTMRADTSITIYNIKDTLISTRVIHTATYLASVPANKELTKHLVYYNNAGLISKTCKYIQDPTNLQWEVLYQDSMVYNHQNQITGYYMGIGDNPGPKYQYREYYMYDNTGDKIQYEEYWFNVIVNSFVPTYKEFYYYGQDLSTPTGYNDYATGINIYPNPANDYIIMENKSVSEQLIYNIFNINGVMLDKGILVNETERIDVSSYPPSIYLLKVYSKDNNLVKTIKIGKQ